MSVRVELSSKGGARRRATKLEHNLGSWQAAAIRNTSVAKCEHCEANVYVAGKMVYGTAVTFRCPRGL